MIEHKKDVASKTVPLAIAGGLILIIVVVTVLSRRSPGDNRAEIHEGSSDMPRGANDDARDFARAEASAEPPAEVDLTFAQWRDVLSTCHPDPDYILTDDDAYRASRIYQFGKQTPTFAANRTRLFNIVAGCYYWNRDKPLEEWKYMFIQKWGPYWDESPHCEIAESSREMEIERRRKNAKYVRKSTKTPPYTGAFTRQEVWDTCKDSTAQIDIEFEITVAVDYRKDLRGNLRSSAEVKDMMCEDVCDFVPGNPDRCCECESAIVDFVFHQQGWE